MLFSMNDKIEEKLQPAKPSLSFNPRDVRLFLSRRGKTWRVG